MAASTPFEPDRQPMGGLDERLDRRGAYVEIRARWFLDVAQTQVIKIYLLSFEPQKAGAIVSKRDHHPLP